MPKKKRFEESDYDPIALDAARDAAVRASRPGVAEAPLETAPTVAVAAPMPSSRPAPLHSQPRDEVGEREPEPRRPIEPRKAERASQASEPADRPGYIKKRFPVTKDEAFDLDEFVQRLRRKSGTSISLATVTRVCVSLSMQVEQEVLAELERDPSPTQPPFQDAEAMAEFEDHWLRLFARALRKLPQTPRRTLER